MRKISRKERGITLIALVITIIVLLILAGVAIATLTGENGILTQAGNAKEETRGASVEEARDLWRINQEEDNQTLEELINDLVNQKLLTEDEKDQVLGNETKGIKATYQVTIGSRTIIFKEKTLAEGINATNYGDYINYKVDLNDDGDTTNDWRIFYDDGENVFIIAADYLPNTKLPSETDMGTDTNYPYSAYWPGTSNLTRAGSSAISETIANKYMLSWRNSYSTSANNNIKAVAALLDTSAWSSFATGVNGAEAVGGPTLEMYVASWNAKGYTPLYCNNSTSTGYYLGNTSSPSTKYIDMSSDANGYADTLYYPHTTSVSNCYGYWLASPSVYSASNVMGVHCKGCVDRRYCNDDDYGVRPVVCLPSGIKATKGIDGVWTIQ